MRRLFVVCCLLYGCKKTQEVFPQGPKPQERSPAHFRILYIEGQGLSDFYSLYYNALRLLGDSIAPASAFPAYGYITTQSTDPLDENGYSPLKIYAVPAGQDTALRFIEPLALTLPPNSYRSVCLYRQGNQLQWLVVDDAPPSNNSQESKIRIINFRSNNYFLTLLKDTLQFSTPPAGYLQASPFITVPRGYYTIKVYDNNQTLVATLTARLDSFQVSQVVLTPSTIFIAY